MEQQEVIYSNVQGESDSNYDMDGLDCPVCLEPYDEGRRTPKMMPCLHTLCTSCITNLTCNNAQKNGLQEVANTTATISAANTARSSRINALINTLETRTGHAALRRIAGQGPTSPTTRQPHDPLPPTPTSSPATPTSHMSVRRPEVSPPLPPNAEPQIPKGLMVICPLCRSEVSTNKLQTNRYVLAHMRDLKRLSRAPSVPEVSFVPQDFWCEECKEPATNTCRYHELTPIAKWVESQRATLESLQMAVEDQLDQHSGHLQGLEDMIKEVFHSLNKASKFIWDTKKRLKEMKEGVKECSTPASGSPREEAERLVKEVAWLEREAAKASRRDLTEGDNDVLVSLHEDDKKRLLVITYNPDLALAITLSHGHTNV